MVPCAGGDQAAYRMSPFSQSGRPARPGPPGPLKRWIARARAFGRWALLWLIVPLPSRLKLPIYRGCFGYRIGRDVSIGLTLIRVGRLEIGDHVRAFDRDLVALAGIDDERANAGFGAGAGGGGDLGEPRAAPCHPVRAGDVLTAHARERVRYGRSGIYDVTVRRGDEVVAEFRGRSRTLDDRPTPE